MAAMEGASREPEIAVAVASHDRPLRLRWLLNALEEQTIPRERFEVIVAHDSSGPETEELLRDHPLARSGTLRHISFEPGESGSQGKLRNAAWRAAVAPLVAFTDDDCRPPADWLENALEAAALHPGAIVQGMTLHDPHEEANVHGPWYHSQRIFPPVPFAQTCNILYPRELLERVGGFLEEAIRTGEDTDLAMRARAEGAPYVGAREVLTYHAVIPQTLAGRLRSLWRWGDLALLVKRHPEMPDAFPLWIFWKRTHVWLPVAAAGAALHRRHPLYGALAIPYLVHTAPGYGIGHPRGRFRSMAELPGRLAIDATEMAALAWGSVRHRSLLL